MQTVVHMVQESLIRCHLAHAGRAQVPKQLQQRAVVKMAVALGDQQGDHLQQGDQGRFMEAAEF